MSEGNSMTFIDQQNKIKVLICDDSALLRVTLRNILETDPVIHVVDMARNGAEAVEKAVRLKPDVVTMDLYMPLMDGLTALKDIVRLKIAPVIMISSITTSDAHTIMEAIEAGAFDFIPKPDEIDSMDIQSAHILQKVKHAAASNLYHKIHAKPNPLLQPLITESTDTLCPHTPSPIKPKSELPPFKAVALGLSTGGPKSIFNVLPQLPRNLNASVIIVQHMPPAFIPTFVQRLNSKTPMECIESETDMKLQPGKVYVARGGSHLKLVKNNPEEIVIQQTQLPPHLFMPSVDIMMYSVCEAFGPNSIGVLMTGMGRDGADGMVQIHKAGGKTIAESEETAIVFGMPQEAIKRGGAQHIVPNWAIASEIMKAVEDDQQ